LHGSANFGHDFNVFDHGPTSTPQFDIHDDTNMVVNDRNDNLTNIFSAGNAMSNVFSANMPRRSSSLRKSTLQQRHGDKSSSWGRKHGAQQLSSLSNEWNIFGNQKTVSTPAPKRDRPRLSLDQFMPPMERESPFNNQGSLPNASVHPFNPQPAPRQHPLSRTLTTSSSSSSIVDESPTHAPASQVAQRKPRIDFSKSLPAGALRPLALQTVAREESEMGQQTFATPENYKAAKPHQAAFMSTGLISKVNHHPDRDIAPRGQRKQAMPDTPCKKPFMFNTVPAPVLRDSVAAELAAKPNRHSIAGSLGSMFDNHSNSDVPNAFARSMFGDGLRGTGLVRRMSFASIDGDDMGSPENKLDNQINMDFEFPPTPTKTNNSFSSSTRLTTDGSPQSVRALPPLSFGSISRPPRTSSKLAFLSRSCQSDDEDDKEAKVEAPVATPSPPTNVFRLSKSSTSSFSRSRALKASNFEGPAPLSTKSLFLSPSSKPGFTKINSSIPASPLDRIDFVENRGPHTPFLNADDEITPETGRLSISNRRPSTRSFIRQVSSASTVMAPPSTPTARSFANNGGVTPVNGNGSTVGEECLNQRFTKVELLGTGEFSVVYKVAKPQQPMAPQSFYHSTSQSPLAARSSPHTLPDQVFAVKKSKDRFVGVKDRQRKYHEVRVLEDLEKSEYGTSEHVIHYVDSWEFDDHLYIQTEYCEEGSLDEFLLKTGSKGRLDDFRIWKILLEIAEGLRHIHNNDYVHLDLKPANVFITFEGVLKIGDFGMAAKWPVGEEGDHEGDREYIGPEILKGTYDKPADIFALGMILLEIAANVVLPDNGEPWRKLRSGDLSDVPSLTFTDSSVRDANGMQVDDSDTSIDSYLSDDEMEDFSLSSEQICGRRRNVSIHRTRGSTSHNPSNLFGNSRRGELDQAPEFMRDPHHPNSLDNLVKQMLLEDYKKRPTVDMILNHEGLKWVASRRRAGASVFEGNWGPADDVLNDDAEMMDV
jgi:mitosis inhibitor protein kinase SWE1